MERVGGVVDAPNVVQERGVVVQECGLVMDVESETDGEGLWGVGRTVGCGAGELEKGDAPGGGVDPLGLRT
jgi:hypothetical protein